MHGHISIIADAGYAGRLSLLLLAAIASGCGAPGAESQSRSAAAESLRLSINRAADGATVNSVELLGLSEVDRAAFARLDSAGRAAALRVFVDAAAADDLPPMLGAVEMEHDALRFTPRFPFAAGMGYRLVLDRRALAGEDAAPMVSTEFRFSIPPRESPPTSITHIFPTTNRLPENQLKFYLHFSAPMSRGQAYRHLHLLDADGQELPAVFLELGEELWGRDMRRFTLLFDPGRVKRGLVPREELGAVLEEGKSYTLVVDARWPDANGKPLLRDERKSFHAVAPDDKPIDPTEWKIEPPADIRLPLVVRFPEPLDHSLLARLLRVTNAANEEIDGFLEIRDGETCWRFMPKQPWTAGEYHLVVDTTLEDLAGNAIGRAFDVDTFEPIGERIEAATISLPFQILNPAAE